MNSKLEVIQKQRKWASSAGLNIDEKGYLPDYESNLFQPMNKMTHEAFEEGNGSELLDKYKITCENARLALVVSIGRQCF